jgi:DNA-binding MarR family transcriptional regulator
MSNNMLPKYIGGMPSQDEDHDVSPGAAAGGLPLEVAVDPVDDLLAQWRRERPDLDVAPMGIVGRLGRLHALLSREVSRVFERHGLQIGEFDVLAALRRAGDPFEQKPSVLARSMMLSPAGMTNRLDRLEALGLISRRDDPGDRRSSLVVLTSQGRRVVDAAVAEHVDNEARLLSALDDRERATLDQILRKLLAGLPPI